MHPCKLRLVYLDNNGTTQLCAPAKRAIYEWLECKSNPSADSPLASRAQDMLATTRAGILKHCGGGKYTVIFTSGASESNSVILRMAATAYRLHRKRIPHIVSSSIEHNSILSTLELMKDEGIVAVTLVDPDIYGRINPQHIEAAITPSTALISVQTANNEIGSINDIRAIGAIAHARHIPFHTDAVQTFGKYTMNLARNNVDALSMSFHKMYGPMGLGLLIISDELIEGYGLRGIIAGTQQGALRGGTENVPAIAGVIPSLKYTFTRRQAKNAYLHSLKVRLIKGLEAVMPRDDYGSYVGREDAPPQQPASQKRRASGAFVVMGPPIEDALPNTVLISFVRPDLCNGDLKKCLRKKKIVVSVGSACATSSAKASHVLYAIRAPKVIRQGIIRISFSDTSTNSDIDTFVKEVVKCIHEQD